MKGLGVSFGEAHVSGALPPSSRRTSVLLLKDVIVNSIISQAKNGNMAQLVLLKGGVMSIETAVKFFMLVLLIL